MQKQTLTDPANDLKMANWSSALTGKLLLGSNQENSRMLTPDTISQYFICMNLAAHT